MRRRFGLGFETKSEIAPSTQRAQAFFLELLPRLKEEVISDLFSAAHQPFLEFLKDSRDEILLIQNDIGSSSGPADTALRIFISSWETLEHQQRADPLCAALRKWAIEWNLTADW